MSRNFKEVVKDFQRALNLSYQNTRNIVKVSERYLAELAEAEQGGGGSSDYSTTEHVVGKWIDGSTDVYERTYTLNNIAFVNQSLVVDATLTKSNCEIVGINGYIYTSDGYGTSLNGIAGIDEWSIGPYLSDSFVIYAGNVNAVTQYAGGSLNCTVRYIKKS